MQALVIIMSILGGLSAGGVVMVPWLVDWQMRREFDRRCNDELHGKPPPVPYAKRKRAKLPVAKVES